ncbi:MAG: hypothetical protein Q9187_005708 [Circinaria calcarea]
MSLYNGPPTSINPELCTLQTCSLDQANYDYIPTLAGNSLFTAIFGILVLAQVFFGIRYRTWGFLVGMFCGITLEIIGYIGRIQSHFNPFPQDPFLLYLICLTIGPAFLSGAIYLCLARIVVVYGEGISRIRPRTYTITFMTFDFLSLLLQAIGGAIASTAETESDIDIGIDIMIAGLSWQVVSLVLFIALCSEFAWRVYKRTGGLEPAFESLRRTRGFKAFLLGLATIFVLIRSSFRVAELSQGFDGELANNEVSFMILEGTMIILACTALTVFHPGPSFAVVAHNSKRSLAEADPNAEKAPQKRTSARVSAKTRGKENAATEIAESKGKENGKTTTAAKPKPKPKSEGRKKPPMLIAKSGADAYNILKQAKEKEKAEKAEIKEREKVEKAERKEKEKVEKAEQKQREKVEIKEREKVEKAERKEKEKVEKAEQKEREKAEKAEAKKREKTDKAKSNGTVTASSADSAHQAPIKAKKVTAKPKTGKPAASEIREKMTPLSAELTAEIQKQIAAVAGQETNEGEYPAKGTNKRPAANKQDASKESGELPVAKEGGKNTQSGNKEGVECSNANCSNLVSGSTTGASKTSKHSNKAQGSIQWVCGCRPIFDVEAQYEDSEDEEAAEQADTCGSKRCICDQAADDHPGHTWVFTKAGKAAFAKWFEEQMKRDQDEHGLYIYNDFSGYGATEVMENQLVEFDKEFKKKTKSAITLWSQMEGISLFLNGDMQAWCMCDDSERNTKVAALIGTALLSTINTLIQEDLFKEGSTIRNLGLILSLFIKFAEETCSDLCEKGESDWTKRVVLMAQDHGVEIKGPYGIEEQLQNIRKKITGDQDDGEDTEDEWEDIEESDGEDGHCKWGKWNWKKEFAAYSREYADRLTGKIGGKHYDITKMSKQVQKMSKQAQKMSKQVQKKHKLGKR